MPHERRGMASRAKTDARNKAPQKARSWSQRSPPGLCEPCHGGLGQRYFLLGLIAQTEALQERRWLGILHGLVLCSCILCGPNLYPCILLPPDLCSGILHGPDLCPRILYGPDPSVLLHGPDRLGIFHNLFWDILHHLCWVTLYGLYRHDLCPYIFLGRPSLELLQQGFRWWLTDFGLTLIGRFRSSSNFVARRRVPCNRQQSLSAGS